MMKIAVASQNKTIQTKELSQLTKDQSFHESSPKHPHPLDTVQVMISGGMGRGLAHRLESKDIQPIITPETDPDTAVNAYLADTLAVETPEEHGHKHNHKHKHNHEAGSEVGQEKEGECSCNPA